jgi:hypothetical protein
MSIFTYASWILGPILQVLLIVFMVRRSFQNAFPRFFSYILFQLVKSGILALFYHFRSDDYFYAYWTGNAISVFLGVMVMDEIWSQLFAPFRAIQSVGTIIFRWACVVLFCVALVMAISTQAEAADRFVAAVFNFDRTMRLMQCGLAVLLLFFSRVLRSFSRQQVFGIAFGFGLFAAIELVLVSILTAYGTRHIAAISLTKSLAYNAVTLMWVFYVRKGLPVAKPATSTHEIADWNFAVIGMPDAVAEGSFLTVVEETVERVLSYSARHKKVS